MKDFNCLKGFVEVDVRRENEMWSVRRDIKEGFVDMGRKRGEGFGLKERFKEGLGRLESVLLKEDPDLPHVIGVSGHVSLFCCCCFFLFLLG